MAITPHQMNLFTASIGEYYEKLEIEIIKLVAKQLKVKGNADISKFYITKMAQLKVLNKEVSTLLSKMSGVAVEEIQQKIVASGYAISEETDEYMVRSGKKLLPPPNLDHVFEGVVKQTMRDIDNFVNQGLITTHYGVGTVTEMYRNILNEVTLKVSTGLTTLDQAVEETMMKWAEKGVDSSFIDKGGRRWNLSHYVKTVIRTTNARVYNEVRTQRMSEYGVFTVVVSSKPKARPDCAMCQGKVVDIRPEHEANSGYPSVYKFNYGEPSGHRGVNCGHHWIPFVPGVNENNQRQYDEQKAIEAENIEQQRKAIARAIVRTKKKLAVAETLESKETQRLSRLLREQQQRMQLFVNKHGLKRDYRFERI